MSPQPLLSRWIVLPLQSPSELNQFLDSGIDPLLGVFTGCLGYYLYETNPRTALPPDQRLATLLQWKWAKWQRERQDGKSAGAGLEGPSELSESH